MRCGEVPRRGSLLAPPPVPPPAALESMEIAPPPRLPARPLQPTAGQGATLGAGPGQPPRSHPSMALELPAVQGEGAALRRHRLPGPQGVISQFTFARRAFPARTHAGPPMPSLVCQPHPEKSSSSVAGCCRRADTHHFALLHQPHWPPLRLLDASPQYTVHRPPSQSPDGRHAHPGNEARRPNSKALPSANSAPGLAPFSLSGAACCHPTRRAQQAGQPASKLPGSLARLSSPARPRHPPSRTVVATNERPATWRRESGSCAPPRRSHSPHSPTCSVPTSLAQTRGLLLRAHEMLGMYEMCWAASHSVHSPAVGPHDLPRAFAPPAAASARATCAERITEDAEPCPDPQSKTPEREGPVRGSEPLGTEYEPLAFFLACMYGRSPRRTTEPVIRARTPRDGRWFAPSSLFLDGAAAVQPGRHEPFIPLTRPPATPGFPYARTKYSAATGSSDVQPVLVSGGHEPKPAAFFCSPQARVADEAWMLVLWTLEDSGEERNHKLPKAPGTFGTLNGRPGTGPMKLFTFTVPVLYRNGMHFVDDTGPPSSVSPQVFANAGTLVGQTLPHGVSFNISSSHLSVRSRQQQQQQYEHRAAAPHAPSNPFAPTSGNGHETTFLVDELAPSSSPSPVVFVSSPAIVSSAMCCVLSPLGPPAPFARTVRDRGADSTPPSVQTRQRLGRLRGSYWYGTNRTYIHTYCIFTALARYGRDGTSAVRRRLSGCQVSPTDDTAEAAYKTSALLCTPSNVIMHARCLLPAGQEQQSPPLVPGTSRPCAQQPTTPDFAAAAAAAVGEEEPTAQPGGGLLAEQGLACPPARARAPGHRSGVGRPPSPLGTRVKAWDATLHRG
ncbi:hypothetical protein PCL_09154 [Purpureocillium lilacinum]|uniref:Uncharacterized protein n=1 Tax=Purpureocillium lilacinum TaxID=33203 RepID=A0A2U3EHA1_PURLI|nr:hypothetical protein PCL_09154 [Purpureocillium lilacinum]